MNIKVPPYVLIRTKISEREWRFEESEEGWLVSDEFEGILEVGRGTGNMSGPLRRFLKRYPWHYEALDHYAMIKFQERKFLEAYAFSQTAIATAKGAFPRDFDPEAHFIPGGFVENRPFLRALYHLMECYEALGDSRSASAVGYELLKLDYEDRMGAHLVLPKHLIREGRFQSAADLFNSEDFKDSFRCEYYLYPLLMIHLGRREEALEAIGECLRYPQVARYLLHPELPQPESDIRFGGFSSGSALEGYCYARSYQSLWRGCPGALNLLFDASREMEKAGGLSSFDKISGDNSI